MNYFLFCILLCVSSIAHADIAPEPGDPPEPSAENPEDTASDDSQKDESEEDSGCNSVSSNYFAGTMLPMMLLGGALLLRNREHPRQ